MSYKSKPVSATSWPNAHRNTAPFWLFLVPLLVAFGMCCVFTASAYGFGDDCASATDASCGYEVYENIDYAGDYDYWKIQLTGGQTVLRAYTTGWQTDTYGYLLDSSCTVIEQDDDDGAGSNFLIERQLNPGTYYVAVRDYNQWASGTWYTLKIECLSDDHGSDCASATSVSCGSTTSGDIESDGDYDYFELTVGSGIVTVYTEYTADNLNTYGYLLDSSCNVIDQDNDSGAGANFSITRTVDAGTYYIAVRGMPDWSGNETGTYTLRVDCEVTYAITATAGAGGSISPSGTVTVEEGGSQTFTMAADPGYSIQDVLVDGASVGQVSSHTFSNVTSNHTISVTFSLPPGMCMGISDTPLDARFRGAPPVIMFVLDDSGSMDWEFLTQENDGKFQGFEYVFDNPGDNVSSGWGGDHILSRGTSRLQWKSQWSGYNKLYYDPSVDYEPWPTLDNADPDNPRSHPINETPTFDLSVIYDTIEEAVIVDNEDANFSKTPSRATVIVDNDDVNFSRSGPWTLRTGSDEAYDGTYYYTRYYTDYTATWTPNLIAGEYVVSAMWDEGSRRSTAVQYTINHAGGSTTVAKSQRIDGGKWVELGTFQFNGDPSENVTLTHTRSGYYDSACADAIMFTSTGAYWDWATSSEAYNSHYFYTPADGDYTATWTPNLDAAQWEVYARWDADDTRSTAVPYTITYAGGASTTTVTVNQRENGGQWVLLGTFDFTGDPSENVTITYTRSGENDTVCADALKFVKDPFTIHIKRAHYYVWSVEQGKPYLVMLDAGITYYAVNDANSNETVEPGELDPIDAGSVPSDVLCSGTYAEERQNFANWYSFYRRRELAAAAAVASVITGMQGVQMGINSINGNLVQPALNVQVGAEDDTATLLAMLYGLTIQNQRTPLRQGLENVGKYYAGQSGGIGDSPYATAGDGGECQQVFAIVMTDGYWNGPDPSVGDTDGDGDTDFDGSPYGDTYYNTLADVAMYYYENDLSAMADLLPTSPSDEATHQHMVTYTVSFGVFGTLNPDDYDLQVGPYPTWPDPDWGDQEKIDDLWHAAFNGRGEFLSASNPTELINSMQSIMSNIQSRIGSASSVSVNGDELYEQLGADIRMFQATYSSDGWTGDVRAYPLDLTTGKVDMTSYLWSAAEELESVDWNTRVIATYDGSTGIPFRFDSLTADQKAQLDPNWETDDTTARNMVNFLRGDDSNEQANGGAFRDRIHLDGQLQKLSDIVDSSPVYNNGMLYFGANDGMLHAIDAETGVERFAYVPKLVFENLKYLSDPSYSHLFFVDLTPSVKDVTIAGVDTLLVGGLGKGGKGYFALDVSNPSSITTEGTLASKALWEFSDSIDLGYTYSKPAIVKSNSLTYPWIVIFGNGYNSEGGYAKLFILDASNGTLIKVLDTTVGDCNGLSSPTPIDVNEDQAVDYVYAGDLKGNLWKFDLTSTDHNDWDFAYKEGSPRPLFQAKGPGGTAQPITTKPDVMEHCAKHGYLVAFGTGQYLGDAAFSDTSTQSLYGIWDYGDDADDTEYLGSFNRGSTPQLSNQADNVELLQQVVYDWRIEGSVELRTLTDYVPSWGTVEDGTAGQLSDPGSSDPNETVHAGWYYDLPDPGERVVSDVSIRDEKLLAITFIPEESACGSGGYSWLHEGDACSGGRLDEPVFDINGDSVIDASDLINVQIGVDEFGNPIYLSVAPTEIKAWGKGRLQFPTILRGGGGGGTEIKYLSSSSGQIEMVTESAITLGISYWLEFN